MARTPSQHHFLRGSQNIAVKGYIVGPVVNSDLEEAVLKTIPEEFKSFDISRMQSEPPAAGMTEIATVIELINNSREVILWGIALWHTKARKSAWRSLRELLNKSNISGASGRRYIPLCISVGDFQGHGVVRFYFHGNPTPEQLDHQWHQMREVLAELPEDQFQKSPGPQEYGFFWDYKNNQWSGQLFESVDGDETLSETWIPNDVFGDPRKLNEKCN